MKVVLRIGGSVLGSPPDTGLLSAFVEILGELQKNDHRIGVVVGGGDIARQYIRAAKSLGLSNEDQDRIAIQASRLNARLVGMKLNGQDLIPESVDDMLSLLRGKKVAVMAGLKPGITTDTVAALVAKAWNADLLVKASNQRGIYTADPSTDRSAKLLREISYSELKQILGGSHRPGIHSIVDPVAVDEIIRNKTRLVVIDGRTPGNVLLAVRGKEVGTIVS
jgi:uridylate kinase